MSQFDISENKDYTKRRLFLDGTVTLQRFDKVHYPRVQKYEDVQRGYIWQPEEVSVLQDRRDMRSASPAQVHMMRSNVLRQTVLDSLQGKAPAQVFVPVCSVPELEALMYSWTFFETNIHSRSYSHIIRNAFPDPSTVFDEVHEIQEIIDMASSIGKHYDALYDANCQAQLGQPLDPYEHKKLIWMALHASYALEAIRFMASFATSLALMEQGIFIGNGKIIELILQDEMLHTEWTAYLIKQCVKEDPDFAKIKAEMVEEVYQLYSDCIREEKDWVKYLVKHGNIIGLNEKILCSFVDFKAATALKEIGIAYREDYPRANPIPWFDKHTNLSAQQTANQELESGEYVVGAISSDVDFDDLPEV